MTRKVKQILSQTTAVMLIMVLLLPYMTAIAGGNADEHQSDMYGIIAPYEGVAPFERVDYAALRLQSLLTRKAEGEFASFNAEERHIVMEHFVMSDEPLSAEAREEMMQAMVSEPMIPEATRFAMLMSERERYSELGEEERALAFRQLYIAYDVVGIVNELFAAMEGDGFTLEESVELIRIMSSGLFDYAEAQIVLELIPSSTDRATALIRFEHFAQRFDIAADVNARRLVNRPFMSTNTFYEASDIRRGGVIEIGLSDHLSANRVEEAYSFSFIEAAQSGARKVEFGIATAIEARHWADAESKTDDDWAAVEPIFRAFTSESAFNEARRMFLSGHCVNEIEIVFALGAALQIEPQPFSEVIDTVSGESYDYDILRDFSDIITYGFAIMDFGAVPMSDTIIEHDHIIANPFNLRFNSSDSVNLNSGAAMFRENVLNIPGRNGFGLNLDLVYNSASADLRRPVTGWGRIETRYLVLVSYVVLYYEHWDGTWFRSYSWGYSDVHQYNPPLQFSSREARDEYIRTVDGEVSREPIDWLDFVYAIFYRHVIPYDNHRYGPINTTAYRRNETVGVGWRFDLPFIEFPETGTGVVSIANQILHVPGRGSFMFSQCPIWHNWRFEDYQLQDMRLDWGGNYFVSGNLRASRVLRFHDGTKYYFYEKTVVERVVVGFKGLVIGKVDRFGNTIKFEYDYQAAFENQFLLSKIIDTNGNEIIFEYSTSGDNRTITVRAHDGSTYEIHMSPIAEHIGFQVDRVKNQVGAVTHFEHTVKESQFNLRAMFEGINHTLLLTKVTYPSGAVLHYYYGYTPHVLALGHGAWRHLWRVRARWLEYDGREYQRTTFEYYGDHLVLGDYTTTVTDVYTGLRIRYLFMGGLNLNRSQRTYDTSVYPHFLLSKKYFWYSNTLPVRTELTEYRRVGTNLYTRETIQRFEHDRFGNLTRILSPLAHGDRNLLEHWTDFEYDYGFSRYGLLTRRTYRPNAYTTIEERNRLGYLSRNISSMSIYKIDVDGNRTRVSQTQFWHHERYGNMMRMREFPEANNYGVFIDTQITYASWTMPSLIRTIGVRDADGNLVGGDGNIDRSFTHDAMWRVVSATDPEGYVTEWEYDAIGRITRIDFPNGGYVTYEYDDEKNTVTHRTVLGAVYIYQYDGFGNLRTVTAYDLETGERTIILTNYYDTQMRLIETRNAQGIYSSQRVQFVYDMFGRVAETRHLCPMGEILQKVTTVYYDVLDTDGNSLIVTTVHGNITYAPSIRSFVQYDRFGRRTQEGVTGGILVEFEHDNIGRVTREMSLGVDNTFTYSVFGMVSRTNIEGNVSRTRYDALGRVTQASDFMGNYTRFTYDALGRLLEQRVPFERVGGVTQYAVTRFAYDRNGNLTRTSTQTNRPGEAEAWTYVANEFRYNQLMATDAGGVNTAYTYNLAGQVVTKNAGGAVTTFTYNNRGQLTSVRDALGENERFTYDLNGLVLTRTDRNGTIFTNEYDAMGRLVREEAVRNGVVMGYRDYRYTLTGALRREAADGHALQNYYDAQGRLFRQSETGGIVREYLYNTANNIVARQAWTANDLSISWAEPSNRTVFVNNSYDYDIAQRLLHMRANGVIDATYTYNANGAVESVVRRNGVTTEYTRNLAGLPTTVVNRHGTTILSRFDTRYTLGGNASSVREMMGGVVRERSFSYDAWGRLTTELETDGPYIIVELRSYWFDERGNRSFMRVMTHGRVLYAVNYEYDLNNRLLREVRTVGEPSVTTYTYDRNGNQLTRFVSVTQPSGSADALTLGIYTPGNAPLPPRSETVTEVSTYNAWNQLVRVVSEDMIAEYRYRADGLRLSKTVNGVVTTHIWDGMFIVLEMNGAGEMVNRFLRGLGGRLLNSYFHGWYLHNARGDVVQLVGDTGGVVLRTYRYTAFGVELAPVEGDTNPWRFAGEYFDRETGRYYLRARFFDPRVGRFTQADPFWNVGNMQSSAAAIIQSGNLFVFGINNPVMFIDPSGMVIQIACFHSAFYSDSSMTLQEFEEALRQFNRALEHLKQSEIFRDLYNRLQNASEIFHVVFNNLGFSYFDFRDLIISWDSTSGLLMRDGTSIQSPAMQLAHEMGHAGQFLDGWYSNRSMSVINAQRQTREADNLRRHETPIARQLGEPTRSRYRHGIDGVTMENSIHFRTTHRVPFWELLTNPIYRGQPRTYIRNHNVPDRLTGR